MNKRVESIIKKRFAELTEIQKKAIPLIEEGKDVLVISPTGSGKTESAMIPILSKVAELEKKGVQVLYITPLKSLNRDILERLEKWCSELEITIAVRHGDTSQQERVKQNETPPQLIVTTPESIQSLLISKMSSSLSNLKYVVVDELHELLESKRGAQLSITLERLSKKSVFQRIGLSATISDEKLASEFISKKAVIVKVDKIREIDLTIEMPEDRIGEIKRIINTHQSTLLFVNTRYEAEYLSTQLFNIKELKDFIAVHHSSLSKDVRLEVEQNFKKGKIKTILCTSSLELGIDIGTIEAVIQYNSPHQVHRLMQRVGRSGHSLNKKPKGYIICLDSLSAIESSVIADEMKEGRLEKTLISEAPLDVLCHSIAGVVLENSPVKASEIYSLVKKAKPYENLTVEKLKSVLTEMHNLRLIFLQNAPDPLLMTTGRTRLYYYLHVSMIPDEKKYFVKNTSTRKMIGVLDEGFVSDYLQEGESFITQGKPWKVLRITEKEILVEETQNIKASIPDWEGEEIPVTMEIARKAAKNFNSEPNFSSKETRDKIIDFSKQNLSFLNPLSITLETQGGNEIVIHSFNGLKANQTLSKLLGFFYKEILRSRVTPYSIVIESEKPLNTGKILQMLKGLSRKDVEYLDRTVMDSPSFRHRFIQVAKRFSLISRDWNAGSMGVKKLINHLPRTSPIIEETFKEVYASILDKKGLEKICSEIEDGKLKIEFLNSQEWTPLAVLALEHGSHSELITNQESAHQIVEAFKKNLQSKKVHLTCMYCNNNFYVELKEDGKISCPYCGSKSVTLEKYRELFKLKKTGIPKMTSENVKAFQASGLINSYGVKALQALEVYGVGVQTAARTLLKNHSDEGKFYEDLLEEQKKFLKNRRFWQIKGKR